MRIKKEFLQASKLLFIIFFAISCSQSVIKNQKEKKMCFIGSGKGRSKWPRGSTRFSFESFYLSKLNWRVNIRTALVGEDWFQYREDAIEGKKVQSSLFKKFHPRNDLSFLVYRESLTLIMDSLFTRKKILKFSNKNQCKEIKEKYCFVEKLKNGEIFKEIYLVHPVNMRKLASFSSTYTKELTNIWTLKVFNQKNKKPSSLQLVFTSCLQGP